MYWRKSYEGKVNKSISSELKLDCTLNLGTIEAAEMADQGRQVLLSAERTGTETGGRQLEGETHLAK